MKSSKVDGRPSFQFYPKDWLSDVAVRSLSPAARGIWIDLLCAMWTSPTRGELRMPNGCGMDANAMRKLCGCDATIMQAALDEMEAVGVFSRCSDGAIYNRRMRRDSDEIERKSDAGRCGADARWMRKHGSPSPSAPSSPPALGKDTNVSLPAAPARAVAVKPPRKPRIPNDQQETVDSLLLAYAEGYEPCAGKAYPGGLAALRDHFGVVAKWLSRQPIKSAALAEWTQAVNYAKDAHLLCPLFGCEFPMTVTGFVNHFSAMNKARVEKAQANAGRQGPRKGADVRSKYDETAN